MFETLRERLEGPLRERLQPLVDQLVTRHITPGQVSWAGAGLSVLAALLIAAGWLRLGALLLLLGGLADLLDGMLARQTDQATPFGAFLDSTLDRLSEGAVLAGIAYQFASQGRPLLVAVAVAALLGSLLVSYTRARAEALGVDCTVGLMSRPERLVVLLLGLLLNLLAPAVLLLTLLSLYTVGERLLHVRDALGGSSD